MRKGPTVGRVAIAAALLAACNGWQMRADDLQASVDRIVASGHRQKDDFVRQFGVPTSCAPLKTGELCQWGAEFVGQGAKPGNPSFDAGSSKPRVTDIVRVEFDGSGNFMAGEAIGRRGRRLYEGRNRGTDSMGSGSTFGDCPLDQSLQNGVCGSLDPIQAEVGPR